MGLLSIITFLPLLGAVGLLFLPEQSSKLIRQIAILTSGITLVVSLLLLIKFEPSTYAFQLVENTNWIPQLGIGYRLGVDGISLWLVILTTFLSFIAVLASVKIDSRIRAFMACLLMLETAMIGSFLSLDVALFFIFFEMTLIPMWLVISLWGGKNRANAANKFLIYTFGGSIFLLIGLIFLGYLQFKATGAVSFYVVDIQNQVAQGKLWAGFLNYQPIVFWAFALAFLVKSPSFPFHTWIPDTYAESPVAGVILSSVMVKLGTYGFLRFCLTLFPDCLKDQIPILVAFAVVGIVYGAAVAAVQVDMRRLMAYSSLSHMGFVLLGIFSLTRIGVMGGALQQLNHGISATILFLLLGFLAERRGSTLLADFGGLKAKTPLLATLFLIGMLSSVGLPGTNGFVGEFLALLGAFQAGLASQFSLGLVVVAAFGVVLAAAYLLPMFQKIFYGTIVNPENLKIEDLKRPELALAGLLVIFIFWGGIFPNTFMRPMEASVEATVLMAKSPEGRRPTWAEFDTSKPDVPAEPAHASLPMPANTPGLAGVGGPKR